MFLFSGVQFIFTFFSLFSLHRLSGDSQAILFTLISSCLQSQEENKNMFLGSLQKQLQALVLALKEVSITRMQLSLISLNFRTDFNFRSLGCASILKEAQNKLMIFFIPASQQPCKRQGKLIFFLLLLFLRFEFN